VWESVAGRLAETENVRAALALVSRGEAPLGIVYATDARADPGVKVVGTFPAATHPPILYPVALTATADGAARAFFAFLTSIAAREAFQAAGFRFLPHGA
jgi:molybdate transport system substrate-binding protein